MSLQKYYVMQKYDNQICQPIFVISVSIHEQCKLLETFSAMHSSMFFYTKLSLNAFSRLHYPTPNSRGSQTFSLEGPKLKLNGGARAKSKHLLFGVVKMQNGPRIQSSLNFAKYYSACCAQTMKIDSND